MTAARRIAEAALLLVAFVGLPLASWLLGSLIASGREEQRDADELEILTAIAVRRPIDLPQLRTGEAFVRLHEAGMLTRLDGRRYLTRAGWARIGRPLSDDEWAVLNEAKRRAAEPTRWLPPWCKPMGAAAWRDINVQCALRWLEHKGLIANGSWDLTPAGRAALGEAPRG